MKIYSHEEAINASIEYFKGDALAASVWVNKYALKDSEDNIYECSPDQMHHRIASELARIEQNYKNSMSESDIYEVLKEFKYIIPQGGPMSGIGNDFQIASLSNCFVIGDNNSDSYGGIMKVDQEQVQLMKRRGGVGHDLSHIRPKGSPVKNSALTSTGIVPFMERYSNSTREVAQDGRRGALMLSCNLRHPNSEDFMDAKLEQNKITGANISVKIDDEFMNAVKNKTSYTQQYPIDSENPSYKKEIDANALWNKIVHNAWKSAEPGILFWDTIIRESVADCYVSNGYGSISTNPCAEIPLCPNDSCRLIAINLYSYVINPFTDKSFFDFDLFKKHVHITQRIMDDIVDLELEKIDKILNKIESDPESDEVKIVEKRLWKNIKEKALKGRRMGIGTTAEGDMLAALNLRYSSEEAIKFCIDIHKTLALEVYRSSMELAKERGSFAVYDVEKEKNNSFILRLKEADPQLYEDMTKYGRRNIALLTVAPTGSVSVLTQTTSGIEPVFLISYKRRKKVNPNDKNVKVNFTDESGDVWEEYNVFHPKFIEWLEINGYDVNAVKSHSEDELKNIIEKSPYYKATSSDVDWINKVKMQGGVQAWVDHSISCTVNINSDATEELVSKIYMTAWEYGCKGVTIYREGSRSGVLVKNEKKEDILTITKSKAPKRPKELPCDINTLMVDGQYWMVLVGLLENDPYEIFAFPKKGVQIHHKFKKGKLIRMKKGVYNLEVGDGDIILENITTLLGSNEQEALTRMVSTALRHGADTGFIVEQLQKSEGTIVSFTKSVARTLKTYISPDSVVNKKADDCEYCGGKGTVKMQEGCKLCINCGQGKCG